jgi:hypothetical protein
MKVNFETRYEENPFLLEVITLKSKNQKIKITNSTEISNDVWINQDGDTLTTQLYTYKEVDETQFVKLFTQNIGLVFNLTGSGIKALSILISMLQNEIRTDLIILDYEYTLRKFLEKHPTLDISKQYFYRGIKELINAQIVAKHKKKGNYFINPNFIFNGDRLLFINAIQKKSKEIEHIK